jgi:catalase
MRIYKKSLLHSLIVVSLFGFQSFSVQAETIPEQDKPVVEQLVNTLTKLAGDHPGERKNHAKGIIVTGSFTPTDAAKNLSSAIHLQHDPSKVTVRFSNATGVPNMPDADANGFPKGISIRFDLGDEGYTDIVCISVNDFPASTPEDFLGLLNAIAATTPESPAPSPIVEYLGSHPAAKQFVEIPKPAPKSFATQKFYGVNAFKFINANGKQQYGRYIIQPIDGEAFLNDEERKAAKDNYLMEELPVRLAKQTVKFELMVQLAAEGDQINDGTEVWPESREKVTLGTLTLTEMDVNGDAFAKANMYNPLALTDGIEPSDDPILMARPGAYAVSFGRRVSGQ